MTLFSLDRPSAGSGSIREEVNERKRQASHSVLQTVGPSGPATSVLLLKDNFAQMATGGIPSHPPSRHGMGKP